MYCVRLHLDIYVLETLNFLSCMHYYICLFPDLTFGCI